MSEQSMNTERTLNISGCYHDVLPAHCVHNSIYIEATDNETLNDILEDIQINYSFRCEEYPEVDFSTGYVNIYSEKQYPY